MKAIKFTLAISGLILFLTVLPEKASARVNFHIGFGRGIGHGRRYSHFGFHGGYHRWPGRRHRIFHHRHFPHHKTWHSSGIWIGGTFPIVIRPPVIVKTPKVITERRVIVEEPKYQYQLYNNDTSDLFEKLRLRKSELLKKLRIGDKEKSKQAIRELAGFSFDIKVREALIDVLLSNPDPELRKQVAKSFGKTSNKNVLPALEIAKANDPNMEVRQEARKAIIKIKGHRL